MFNLIKNELIKIFKKKSILVLLIISLAFIILTNFIYKNLNDDLFGLDSFIEEVDEANIKEEMKGLNLKNRDDLMDYISYKTDLDLISLKQNYKSSSWQYYIIDNVIHSTVYDINYYTYSVESNNKIVLEKKKLYEEQIKMLKDDNWKFFIEEDIKNLNNELSLNIEQISGETNKKKKVELQKQIDIAKLNVEKQKFRLDNNINNSNTYLNNALESYYSFKISEVNYDSEKSTYSQKLEHNNELSTMAKAKYAIDNKVDTFTDKGSRGILINFFNEYSMLIVIGVIMIAGGIVSEEFSKGTIKFLLIRPHSRSKILLSKLISSIISIFLLTFTLFLLQFIVGSIFFGFKDLNIPVVVYNFNLNEIQTYNVFVYFLWMFGANLPKLILLSILAFSISTIFKNTSLATSLGIMGYIASGIINAIVSVSNLKIFKYFVTLNWNFEEYLFGGLPSFKYVNLPFSIIICIIYVIIMLIPTFIIFKKSNVKNT